MGRKTRAGPGRFESDPGPYVHSIAQPGLKSLALLLFSVLFLPALFVWGAGMAGAGLLGVGEAHRLCLVDPGYRATELPAGAGHLAEAGLSIAPGVLSAKGVRGERCRGHPCL